MYLRIARKTTTILALALWATCHCPASAAATALDEAALEARSLVSAGDPARLQHVMTRARDGKPVTVAVFGGSITAGKAASTPENRYGNLVAQWWRSKFPTATIDFVNAGFGATGSNYGALRAPHDLLPKKPDFVVVEFAVNDVDGPRAAESLEGLVRQILSQPQQPAVVLLFTMRQDGTNAEDWHGKVGSHYALPMVSMRDALWPEIEAGRLQWKDVGVDKVHPNDRGHRYCAQFLTAMLDQVLAKLPPAQDLAAIPALPAPLFSDLFEHTSLVEAPAMHPASNQGWALDSQAGWWKATAPGSTLELELEGKVLFADYQIDDGPMGKVRVTVDGKNPRELDGWTAAGWGAHPRIDRITGPEVGGKHLVRFELLATRNPKSAGNEFRLLAVGAAGVPAP